MEDSLLSSLYEKKFLTSLDFHFTRFISELAGTEIPEVSLAAALVSKHTSEGHICLDLSTIAGNSIMIDHEEAVTCPLLSQWLEILEQSPVVGHDGQYRPLIVHNSRLYLERYRRYEKKLIELIHKRLMMKNNIVSHERLKDSLNRLFPKNNNKEVNWQKVAAFVSATRRFSVISGGPGTGKTTTVVSILALLCEQVQGDEKLHIALTAPTGKAAARLKEAISKARARLSCSETIKEQIPDEVSTIHRLLGTQGNVFSGYYRGNTPLPVDVIVVDEASMAALPLMSRLIEAARADTRFILLGDRDQLASVEAGAVLGDICGDGQLNNFSSDLCSDLESVAGEKINPPVHSHPDSIENYIVQLQKSHRFQTDKGIGKVSRCVRSGDHEAALNEIKNKSNHDITWINLPRREALSLILQEQIVNAFQVYLKTDDPLEALKRFDQFRILCAIRNGPYGVVSINSHVEHILRQANLINPTQLWYQGRPVMITRNDYNLRLFNGDVGLTLPDNETDGQLRVFFPGADGTVRKFFPRMLTEYETVYAMTVHKSQGSEFDRVLFIMPDRNAPVLSRELVYTALTRAKKNVTVMGLENVFRLAVSERIERASGLKQGLWNR